MQGEGTSKTFKLQSSDEDVQRSTVKGLDSIFGAQKDIPKEKSELSNASEKRVKKRRHKRKKKKKEEQKQRKEKEKTEKKKKKKANIDEDSEECLRIEFAELLAEPTNTYCPSMHAWREWLPRRDWIDLDQARTETIQALATSSKWLPSRNFGPPLP